MVGPHGSALGPNEMLPSGRRNVYVTVEPAATPWIAMTPEAGLLVVDGR